MSQPLLNESVHICTLEVADGRNEISVAGSWIAVEQSSETAELSRMLSVRSNIFWMYSEQYIVSRRLEQEAESQISVRIAQHRTPWSAFAEDLPAHDNCLPSLMYIL